MPYGEHSVKARNFEPQMARLARIDEVAKKHITDAMRQSADEVADRARDKAPMRTGIMSASVKPIVEAGPDIVGKVIVPTFYSRFVEFGTAPHGVPDEALAAKMGVNEERAFHIARSIARKGTKGKFFLWRAWKESEKEIGRLFRKARDKIAETLAVK